MKYNHPFKVLNESYPQDTKTIDNRLGSKLKEAISFLELVHCAETIDSKFLKKAIVILNSIKTNEKIK